MKRLKSRLSFGARRLGRLALILLAVTIVGGCTAPPDGSSANPPPDRPAYTVTVILGQGETPEQIAARFGGEILVWHGHDEIVAELAPDGADYDAFAVVAIEDGELHLHALAGAGDLCAQAATAGEPARQAAPGSFCVEANEPAFLAGGQRTLLTATAESAWAEGRTRLEQTILVEGWSSLWNEGWSSLWNEGWSSLWNEGEFVWLPENSDVWQSIHLEMGHYLAQNLGKGVIVAVIDTGVDLDHPYLAQGLVEAGLWLDLVDGDRWPHEIGAYGDSRTAAYGHGTSVAGIVRQVAPRAQIMPIRVLQPDGRGYVTDLIAAIEHAVAAGADIINLSLGSAERSEALSYVIGRATQQGVFVVMSAGNTGLMPVRTGQVTFPATEGNDVLIPGHRYRLTVTSVDSDDLKSSFAAHGVAVGLAAHGEGVWGPAPAGRIAAWSGTSMAAPMAAGALALALGEAGDLLDVERRDLALRLMHEGADLYGHGNSEYVEWSQLGFSRLDIWLFLDAVLR